MPSTEPARRTIIVECSEPVAPDEVELFRLAREGDLELRFTWSDLPTGPSEYLVLLSSAPDGRFEALDAASTGSPGLLGPLPAPTTYYRVAARYEPGCLGP